MKRLDRYVLTEMLPPFLFGIGAFLAVLVGVQLLYEMLRLIYQQGFPAWAAVRIFFLELPAVITLTFPMATIFGSLMAVARLSGEGELVAMRAGGISIMRIGRPIIIASFLVSIPTLLILALPFNDASVGRVNWSQSFGKTRTLLSDGRT